MLKTATIIYVSMSKPSVTSQVRFTVKALRERRGGGVKKTECEREKQGEREEEKDRNGKRGAEKETLCEQ